MDEGGKGSARRGQARGQSLALLFGLGIALACVVGPPAEGALYPEYGGALRLLCLDQFEEVDPLLAIEPLDQLVSRHVYARLFADSGDGGVEPVLAANAAEEDQGRRWRIVLREGLAFHSGRPLTATDVRYSLVRAAQTRECGAGMVLAAELRTEEGSWSGAVVAEDDRTLAITLARPCPWLPELLSSTAFGIVPAGWEATRPVDGSGPFRLVSRSGTKVVLGQFAEYVQGRPFLDTIEIEQVPLEQGSLKLQLGEAEALLISLWPSAGPPPQGIVPHELAPPETIVLAAQGDAGQWRGPVLGLLGPKIAGDSIVGALLAGWGRPARGLLPALGEADALWELARQSLPAIGRQNPLGESALPGLPRPLPIGLPAALKRAAPLAERIRLQLADAGIVATVRPVTPGEAKRWQGLLLRRLVFPGPAVEVELAYLAELGNRAGVAMPAELASCLVEPKPAPGAPAGLSAALGSVARAAVALQKALGWLPLLHPQRWLLASPRLVGVRISGDGQPLFEDAWIWAAGGTAAASGSP